MNETASQAVNAPPFEVEVFFDGACPLCLREINMLKRWDRKGRIRFTDIAARDFSAAALGKSYDELMARIHGRLPDGTWIEGVEVFRRLYAAVGLGLIVGITRWPGISQLFDLGYRVFARNRLRFTGRCHDGACTVPRRTQA
jgi:predicted DCC family thiol-disulfide oxidoreductase YuxK